MKNELIISFFKFVDVWKKRIIVDIKTYDVQKEMKKRLWKKYEEYSW